MPSYMARIRERFTDLSAGSATGDTLRLNIDSVKQDPQDVTAIDSPTQGQTAYNDGTVGTEGPAFYNGSGWVSTVDGTAIA